MKIPNITHNTALTQKVPNEQTDNRGTLLLESRTSNKTLNHPPKTTLKKRLSPLRYPGGKSKVIDQIYAFLDEQCLNRFVELFAGGASLGLSLLDAGKIDILELNELDPAVHNFWNVVLNRSDDLIERLYGPLPTMRDYMSAKARIKETQSNTKECDVEAAYDYFLLNRTSFGGIIFANPVGGKNGTDEQLRQRWNPSALARRISGIAEIKERILLTRQDAVEFLRKGRNRYKNDAAIFIDPPYVRAGKKLYTEMFDGRHEELAEVIAEYYCSHTGPQILLTYDDCEFIRELYPYAKTQRLSTSWSIYRAENKAF